MFYLKASKPRLIVWKQFKKQAKKYIVCKKAMYIHCNLIWLIYVLPRTAVDAPWDAEPVAIQLVILITHVKIPKFWLNTTISAKDKK